MIFRDEAIARLRAHRQQLEAVGVRHAAIFGSVARGDNRPDSDVDVLVDVDAGRVRSLFDLARIQSHVEEIVGGQVDVARRDRLRPHVAAEAERDAIYAF
jgi:predicted nucleotidyltransferase